MINMFDLKAGDRVELLGGRAAEVVENMEDGMWVQVRADDGDDLELCHAQDIARMLPSTPAD